MASEAHYRLLTAEEFLQIEFGPDMKAELDEGVIRMMAGGTRDHARIQMNLYGFLRNVLRGSGCRPYGSDMAVRTSNHSVRYPDLTIDCGGDAGNNPDDRLLQDPRVIMEVLSSSTRRADEGVKLAEYRQLPGVDTIVLIDPATERCRILQHTGEGAWSDVTYSVPAELALPSLDITIPHAEIFARD